MATRNSSGVERRRVPLDANRPRTHPKHPGHKATKVRPPSAERRGVSADGDVLERLSRAISLVETIARAMQTHEDDSELGAWATIGTAAVSDSLEPAYRWSVTLSSKSPHPRGEPRARGSASARSRTGKDRPGRASVPSRASPPMGVEPTSSSAEPSLPLYSLLTFASLNTGSCGDPPQLSCFSPVPIPVSEPTERPS